MLGLGPYLVFICGVVSAGVRSPAAASAVDVLAEDTSLQRSAGALDTTEKSNQQ